MYSSVNFKTKKELKAAISAGRHIEAVEVGPFPAKRNGRACIEGPHYPEPHRWYASVELKDGKIVKVT